VESEVFPIAISYHRHHRQPKTGVQSETIYEEYRGSEDPTYTYLQKKLIEEQLKSRSPLHEAGKESISSSGVFSSPRHESVPKKTRKRITEPVTNEELISDLILS